MKDNRMGKIVSGITFAPGEQEVNSVQVSPSVILFWLKTELAATNMRIGWRAPNTLLGVIPLGYREDTVPLANTASVNVNVKFSLGRLIFGIILLIIAFTLFPTDAWWLGLLLLIWSIACLANAFSASLDIRNNGGAVQSITVSVFEKSKLEDFKNRVQHQLFSDHARLRHEESMNVQQAQLYVQQSQLNAHLAGNQHQPNQSQPYQQSHPQQPPQPPAQAQQPPHTQPLPPQQHGGPQIPPGSSPAPGAAPGMPPTPPPPPQQ